MLPVLIATIGTDLNTVEEAVSLFISGHKSTKVKNITRIRKKTWDRAEFTMNKKNYECHWDSRDKAWHIHKY